MAVNTNFIKQIKAGEVTHDIAVAHGIKFKYGAADANPVVWDGSLTATNAAYDEDGAGYLVVTIPSVTDIIKSPVIYAGTVDSTGAIDYVEGLSSNPKDGYLVYITADCTFAGQVCEAGDMAVYSNNAWHVVTGENQVSIANPDGVKLTGTLQNVLTVEGKELKLAIDYSDILAKIKVDKNAAAPIDVANGSVTVPSIYLGLSKETDGGLAISKTESFDLPTKLANGDVTINEKVLTADNITFDKGTLPSATKNTAKNLTASHSMSLSKGAGDDFVSSVTAIKSATLVGQDSSAGAQITFVSGIAAADSTSFVSGIHARKEGDTGNADLVIPGVPSIAADANTFAYGLSEEKASGDLVSSITVGAVTANTTGSDFLRGTTSGADTFVSSVTFGSVMEDTTKSWFLAGTNTTGTDFVSNVTVGAVSFISDSNSSFASPAIVSASVNDHVLSFSTGSFMTPVNISKAADTITKGGFTKGGVKLDGFAQKTDTFTKGGITQATTNISYKDLSTKAVTLTGGTATDYFFDKAASKSYTAQLSYAKINTEAATVSTSAYTIANPTVTVTIPADTFISGFEAGTLPSLSIAAANGTLTGSVGTALTTVSKDITAVDVSKMEAVKIPGAYSLTSSSTAATGSIEVGKAGKVSLDAGANITIPADTYITDVYVNGSKAGKNA